MTYPVLVLFGARRSGKNTGAALIHRLSKSNYWKEAAFADPIKHMVRLAFPKMTHEQLHGPSSAREQPNPHYPIGERCVSCGNRLAAIPRDLVDTLPGMNLWCPSCLAQYPNTITARLACQSLGTEWGRRLNQDIWANAVLDGIQRPTIVTDGRFPNEHAAAKKAGGLTAVLLRNYDPETRSTHASDLGLYEIPFQDFDVVVDNRGDLLSYAAQLKELLRYHFPHSLEHKESPYALMCKDLETT